MGISFERSGGVANITLSAQVDTEAQHLVYGAKKLERPLSPEETRILVDLVRAADFFNLPVAINKRVRGADRFQYTIRVEDKGQQHTVRITDDAGLPPALRSLLKRLSNMAVGRS